MNGDLAYRFNSLEQKINENQRAILARLSTRTVEGKQPSSEELIRETGRSSGRTHLFNESYIPPQKRDLAGTAVATPFGTSKTPKGVTIDDEEEDEKHD